MQNSLGQFRPEIDLPINNLTCAVDFSTEEEDEDDADDLKYRTFSGTASIFGIPDYMGRIIAPGSFSNRVLADFTKSRGFITNAHDTYGVPVGFPLELTQTDAGLYLKFAFHKPEDNPLAKSLMSSLKERKQYGLQSGLSIGAWVDKSGVKYFESAELCLAYAKENNISLVEAAVRKFQGSVLLFTKFSRLVEVAVTFVPANEPCHDITQAATDLELVNQLCLKTLAARTKIVTNH